jgi:uncharacterized membrane protein
MKYTGYSYVKKLERELRKLPYEEREDAVRYYTEYFAEAGIEREREIIERLGPPQRVAAEIRADAALREIQEKTARREKIKARDSIAAAGLGAASMLAMPVARPLAVLAFVLGIIALVACVVVVVAIYIVAGAAVIGGGLTCAGSVMLFAQDTSVGMYYGGIGLATLGAGIAVGTLNYLLGRAVFKGIANLSGRIRHKRVKVRKDAFEQQGTYSYAYADGANEAPAGAADYANEAPSEAAEAAGAAPAQEPDPNARVTDRPSL